MASRSFLSTINNTCCNLLLLPSSSNFTNQKYHMRTIQQKGRIVGGLFLFVFITGIIIYQFLRGPIVFADNYLENTALQSNQIITSTLLGFLSGIVSIIIATILLPIFKQYSKSLAYLYLAFSLVNFVAITFENFATLELLEVSREFIKTGLAGGEFLKSMGTISYQNHRWAHLMYLLVSCLPVFVLYYSLFRAKLIPKAISIFGIIASVLMFISVLSSILKIDLGIDLLIPIGLVQLLLPLWLIVKGFKNNTSSSEAV